MLVAKDYPVKDNLNKDYSGYVLADRINGFYELKENSLDVVCVGSSHIHCDINPLLLWKEYGITAYDFSADSQGLQTTYYFAKEVFKTQSPKKLVVLINIDGGLQNDNSAHWSFDFLPFSLNKLEAVNNCTEKADKLSYILPLVDFHSRWKEVTTDDFRYLTASREHPFNGYFAYCESVKLNKPEDDGDTKIAELSESYRNTIDNLYSLCEANDCELIFMRTPCENANDYSETVNAVKAYTDKYNTKVLDYRYDDRLNIDWNRDFSDKVHTNYLGAEKVTKILGLDLTEDFTPEEKDIATKGEYDGKLLYYESLVSEHPIK